MGSVWLIWRAELRRRWQSWLVLAGLIALVGGLVVGAAAASRRTTTAFPRFVSAHGYDFIVFNSVPIPAMESLPGVSSVTTAEAPINGPLECTCTSNLNNADASFFDFSPTALDRVVKLVAGRMPNQSSPDEVLASVNLEQDYGIRIGSVVHASFFSLRQENAAIDGTAATPAGPSVTFHVVGIEIAEDEFPQGQTPSYDFYTTQAFAGYARSRVAFAYEDLVRLKDSSSLPHFAAAVSAKHYFYVENQDTLATAVAASIHPQGVGWWVLAILTAIAGLAVVGQALGRQSAVEGEEYTTLAALGVSRGQLLAACTARNVLVGVIGGIGALLVAFLLSPLTPVGEARLAEPTTGFAFDSWILIPGALIVTMAVLALGIWPSVRASRHRTTDRRNVRTTPSPIVEQLAAAGAPVSVVIGVRHALERGRGVSSVPVGTALFGTALAVFALCVTAVFGASLSQLVATPQFYGQNYQLAFSNHGNGENAGAELAALKRDPAVVGIMTGFREEISVNRVSVLAVGGTAVRGPLLLSTVSGRLPRALDEVSLGTTTLKQVGASIGSEVRVTVQVPSGGTRTTLFKVVGSASFPGDFGLGGLGTGAAFTTPALTNAICPTGPAEAACRSQLRANVQGHGIFARTVSGPKGESTVKKFLQEFPNNASLPITPISLVNFGEAIDFPLILGFMLALFGIATLLHLLVVSTSRRRREVGLLRALGFVRHQVRAAVCWQATTIGLIGMVVGIPLGVLAGQFVWRAFATNIGAVPVATVPVWLIAVLGLGTLTVTNVIAAAPAFVAGRSKPTSQLLRTA